MNPFKSQPLAIAPAFLSAVAKLAKQPRIRAGDPPMLPAGTRFAYRELIGVLKPQVTAPLSAQLRRDAADDRIGGVILYIDSPGGLIAGVPELATTVGLVARRKPIHVVAENYLASAALWVASQATSITASPSTLTGSIGVIRVLVDDSEMFRAMGVKVIAITSGESTIKAVGVPGVEISDEQLAFLQQLTDFAGLQFEAAIERGRKLTPQQRKRVANGQVWYAAVAKSLGLVDFVEPFEDAIARIESTLAAEKYADLTGPSAYSQFLALANYGVPEEDAYLDLDDVPKSVHSKLTKQFPSLAAAAVAYESNGRYSRR